MKVSYSHINKLLIQLHKAVREVKKIDFVTGPPRSGVLVASMFSYKTQIPFLVNFNQICSNTNVLILDDIWETGTSVRKFQQKLPKCHVHTATLYKRNSEPTSPDVFITLADTWIQFPWETSSEEKIQDYLKHQ